MRCDAIRAQAIFATNLVLLMLAISLWLHFATRWRVLPPSWRVVLSDYAVTIAVLVTTGVSFLAPHGVHVERIDLPDSIVPTCVPTGGDTCSDADDDGGAARQWGASFGAISTGTHPLILKQ